MNEAADVLPDHPPEEDMEQLTLLPFKLPQQLQERDLLSISSTTSTVSFTSSSSISTFPSSISSLPLASPSVRHRASSVDRFNDEDVNNRTGDNRRERRSNDTINNTGNDGRNNTQRLEDVEPSTRIHVRDVKPDSVYICLFYMALAVILIMLILGFIMLKIHTLENKVEDLQSHRELSHSAEKKITESPYLVSVYEERVDLEGGTIGYLNQASKEYSERAPGVKFVEHVNGTSSYLGLYVVMFSRRLRQDEEEKIATLKSEGMQNVIMVTLQFNRPQNEIPAIDFPANISGYDCHNERYALTLDLTYYSFDTGTRILPAVCNEDGDCDAHNANQLRHFFNSISKFFAKCM